MTLSKEDLFDKHSIRYRKWLTKITHEGFGRPIYVVWLTDTSDNDDDKILTNSKGRVIAARNPATLIGYILTTKEKLFDSRQTKAWARKIKGTKLEIAASYDLDQVNSLTKRIDQDGLEEVSNFINLFTDLITTTKAVKLEQLIRRREVKAIWEYFYNYVFWPRFNDPRKFKGLAVKPFKSDAKLQATLQMMTNELIQRIEIVQ